MWTKKKKELFSNQRSQRCLFIIKQWIQEWTSITYMTGLKFTLNMLGPNGWYFQSFLSSLINYETATALPFEYCRHAFENCYEHNRFNPSVSPGRDTCPCCPHNFNKPCQHTSTEEVFKRICALVSDDDGCLLIDRQLTLINHLLGISNGRIKMREVKYLTFILEFFCEFLAETPQYKNALWCLLRLCQKPPLLSTRSETLGAEEILSDYFTGLGNCLIIVEDPDIKTLIIEVLHNLLGKRDQDDVPYDVCVKALVKSRIGDKLSKLIYVINDEFYPQILDLILKYAIMSKDCAMVLLDGDIIFWLLSRLELQPCSYSTVPAYISELTSSIIWRLLSYLGKNKISQPMNLQEEIMRLLRNWFRREVLYGKPQVRNDVATIICRILYTYSSDHVLKSGIFEDICLLAFATEFEYKYSWAKSVKFPPTPENLNLKKILILIVCAMFKHPGIRLVADNYNVLPGLSLLISTDSGKSDTVDWPPEYRCQLISYALHALPIFAEYLPEKYMASGVTRKILDLLENSAKLPQAAELMKCSLHCLNSLLIKGICSEHFPQEMTPVVLDVVYRILKKPLTLMSQLLLSHSFILISTLSKVSPQRSDSFNLISSIGLEIIRRIHQPHELDSKMDGSLQITAVNYIWHAIVKNPRISQIFVDRGGIYLLLDLAKTSCLPLQVLLMGLLSDMSDDRSAVPQLITWRGETEKETVLALLCSIWRKQESIKGVKRSKNGCINESSVILEGKVQAGLAPSWKYCPAITEMQGCARPKIYGIFYNILRRHHQTSEAAREAYGVDFRNIGYKDEITLKIINNYEFFKKGEVWRNLWRGLLEIKIKLLPQIETALFILSKTYLYTAGNIATLQQSVNANEINKDLDREKALYDSLRSCMLTEALDAFMIIRNELYSTNKEQATKAKVLMEKELAEQRQILDIDVMVPEYHATRIVGVNLSKGRPSQALRIRRNSNLLRPDEHLHKKETKRSESSKETKKSETSRTSVRKETLLIRQISDDSMQSGK